MTPAAATIAQLEDDLRACAREIELSKSKAHLRDWQKQHDKITAQITMIKAALPPSHLEAISAAGFDVLGFQPVAAEVLRADGTVGSEWLPEDLVHWEQHRFVRWRYDSGYDFAGWCPKTESHSGGRCRTVHEALGWFAWHDSQVAR